MTSDWLGQLRRGNPRGLTELTPFLLAMAAVAMGYVLQWTHGHYLADAVYVVLAAWLCTLVALVVRAQVKLRLLELLLLGAAMAQLYLLSVSPPSIEMTGLRDPREFHNFLLGLFIVAVLCGLGLGQGSVVEKLWFPAAVAVHFWLGLQVLKWGPNPQIDVYGIEVDSLKALLSGTNPYSITFPNPYGDNSPFFPPGVSVNGRLQFGFVYPPLALLLCLPGWLLKNDPRVSTLMAMSAAALLMAYARPSNISKLAAVLFLFTPRSFFVLDRAWTDPFVVMLTALVAFTALRAPRFLFVAVGLYLCLKQHMFIGIPALFLLMPRPFNWKEIGKTTWKAAAVAFGITLPFFLWGPKAFANSVLDIREVYRLDCLSFISYFANQGYGQLSKWSGLVAIFPVAIIGLWKAPRNALGFAALATATHFTLYAFSTHAFCNEYYNVVGGLWLAVAVWRPGDAASKSNEVPAQLTAQPEPLAA